MAVWIEDYRRQYGLEADDFARMVNVVGRKMVPPLQGTVSDTLIYILETSKKPRTQPRIADAIATVCHATSEQRNSIVDRKHQCADWEPIVVAVKEEQPKPVNIFHCEKSVVRLDKSGNVIGRYSSISEAARINEMSVKVIRAICRREKKYVFERYGCTYRFTEEWDKMTNDQKIQDMKG